MKKVNIAELLKDCPKGMELDSPVLIGKKTFKGFRKWHKDCPIEVQVDSDVYFLTRYGQLYDVPTCGCVIFPKGKTTWEGFVPPCKFKDGDVVYVESCYEYIIIYKETPCDNLYKYVAIHNDYFLPDAGCPVCNKPEIKEMRLATEEEKEKLFKAIKDNGFRWNAETKTLEKLPKFKVGDKVRGKYTNHIYTISDITPTGYKLTNGQSFDFDSEDCHELVSNKFDITTLKPFSEVLVRYDSGGPWMAAHFSHYTKDPEWGLPYFASGACFRQCIPYKGNEHLRGTTNDCEDFYKTWK